MWASSDRGNDWGTAPRSFIDSAEVAYPYTKDGKQEVEIGRSAWPQLEGSRYIPGGWDRQNIYADPFSDRNNPTLYALLPSDSGGGDYADHSTYQTLVFVSHTGGRTWTSDGQGHPRPIQVLPRCKPLAMTTNRNGLSFMYGSVGEVSALWVLNDGGTTVRRHDVYYGGGKTPTTIVYGAPPSAIPGGLRNAWNWDVSRAADGVRIVYPSRTEDKPDASQIARVIFVRFPDPDGPPEVHDVAEIRPQDPKGHVLYPTFIETDRVELPQDNPSDDAMLYWVETSGDQIRTRYSLFHGELGWTTPQDLSTTTWKVQGDFDIGDYMRGAFFYDGQLNFLAQWPQRSDSKGNALNQIRYRILRVQPTA